MSQISQLTTQELIGLGENLISEISGELSSNRWAIWNGGSKNQKYLIYSAASLRNCAKLLEELLAAATDSREMTLRIVGRAHIEAFIYSLYLHQGGYEALLRIMANAKSLNIRLANDLEEWNQWLTSERSRTKKRLRRIRKHNENLKLRNQILDESHQLHLVDEPHLPRANFAQIDLDVIRESPKDVNPQVLSVIDVIHLLSGLGATKGFSKESFIPIYHVYRVLSSVGPHPTPYVFDAYIMSQFDAAFIRTVSSPKPPSSVNQTLVNALFSTALLSEWILNADEEHAPVSRAIRQSLEPDAGDLKGWTPGIP